MASTSNASISWMGPGSPTKSTLQRGNATTRDTRDGWSPRKGDREPADRLRHLSSPMLGKGEIFPLTSEDRGRPEAKSTKMSFFRGLSPERRGNAEAKGRSVSPSKRSKKEARGEEQEIDAPGMLSRSPRKVDDDFDKMLIEMEVAATLRQKLVTLDSKVKESMMKGQATLNLGMLSAATSAGKSRPPISDRLRKSKSSHDSLPDEGGWEELELMPPPPDRGAVFGRHDYRSASGGSSNPASSCEAKEATRSLLPPPLSSSSPYIPSSAPRSRSGSLSSANFGASSSSATAASFATLLKTTDSSRLDVAQVKRMRAVLSSESPTWIGEFVEEGGYAAMVTRLKELLNLEWREEQHDDQLLHELLRCFVALSTTERGLTTLQSMTPTPFVELSGLLFSEKRPGDLSTRKLLVELLTLLPDLPSTGVSAHWEAVREERESSTVSSILCNDSGNFALLVTLLHNLLDPTQEAKVDFIKAINAPRPFKSFVSELLNINRDYFWVFCHSNRFWSLQDINVDEVECPKVPGGMTGGVEFEAMAYLTSLFRLLNSVCARLLTLAKLRSNRALVYDFHSLLFSSGIDRALAATRKASQTYYQPLHLELARYFDNAHEAGFRLPAELEAWQSCPRLLHTPDYRYFDSEQPVQKAASSSRSESPEKISARAAVEARALQSRVENTSSSELGPLSSEGAANGNTGKWLGGNKRSSRDQSSHHYDREQSDLAGAKLGPLLFNPHSITADQENGRAGAVPIRPKAQGPRGNTVNHAVQKWEQLTAKNQGNSSQSGLGLGWAPSR